MSFNWPTTGFTGTEVEAFETAYKELAEGIISCYEMQEYGDAIPTSTLYAPYKNGDMMEFLLQEAFLYASFIIKQRAGNAGPGTDFILGSSPFQVELPKDELGEFYKNLGCVFDKQEMIDSWNWNKDNNIDWYNPLDPTGVWSEALEGLIDKLIMGRDGKGSNSLMDEYIGDEEDPDRYWWEDPLIKFWRDIFNPVWHTLTGFAGGGQRWGKEMANLTLQYLKNDKTAFTENNMSASRREGMKNEIQRIIDRSRGVWPTFHSQCGGGYRSCTSVARLNITDQYTASEKAQYNLPAGGNIYEVTFYGTNLEGLFGTARVTTDAAGNVLGVYDDFDFVYGFEIRRETPGNGIHGMSYNNGDVTHGSYFNSSVWENGTDEQKSDDTARVRDEYNLDLKREIIAGGHYQNRGLPVPIRIQF
tara:strand:- start:5300 stop:6550 length:1251 start_codon:yes stop_codon:yes gene_type:complete